ncbi:MAG TPA: hypothetical protein PKW51_00230, partial [Methanoregulaceae archaeon]|nr:hypothetical protein [Methanoregulaceae archaeon]
MQPDTYVLDKDGLTILDVRVGHQDFRIVRGPDGHDHTEYLDAATADTRVLDDDELRAVALESNRIIDIESFVAADTVGWEWYDTPHFLTPSDKVG